jgi:hypothetical protein
MALQLAPLESHRSHWYAYERLLPLHEPVEAVSALPICVVPLIAGGD